jgi:hypothetical protein
MVSVVRRIEFGLQSRLHVSPRPFRDGWMPFLCEGVKSIASDRTIQRLEGWLDGERKSFYVRDGRLSEGAPFFLKQENEQWFVSTLASDAKSIEPKTFRAFVFESEVHDLAPPVVAKPQLNRPRPTRRLTPSSKFRQSKQQAGQKAQPKAPKKKARKRQQHKKPNQPPPPPPLDQRTSLVVAMEEAKKKSAGSTNIFSRPTADKTS